MNDVCVYTHPQVRSEWSWRRRKAIALLIFGVIASIASTDAILSAVQEEAAVVELAQQLVAHEVVVVETTRRVGLLAGCQRPPPATVAAVPVVQTAPAELEAAQANTTFTP